MCKKHNKDHLVVVGVSFRQMQTMQSKSNIYTLLGFRMVSCCCRVLLSPELIISMCADLYESRYFGSLQVGSIQLCERQGHKQWWFKGQLLLHVNMERVIIPFSNTWRSPGVQSSSVRYSSKFTSRSDRVILRETHTKSSKYNCIEQSVPKIFSRKPLLQRASSKTTSELKTTLLGQCPIDR